MSLNLFGEIFTAITTPWGGLKIGTGAIIGLGRGLGGGRTVGGSIGGIGIGLRRRLGRGLGRRRLIGSRIRGIGVGLGMLFTNKSGKENREALKKKIVDNICNTNDARYICRLGIYADYLTEECVNCLTATIIKTELEPTLKNINKSVEIVSGVIIKTDESIQKLRGFLSKTPLKLLGQVSKLSGKAAKGFFSGLCSAFKLFSKK